MKVLQPFTIGLALGGGGARGMAHVGVLRELADAGIRPDVIAGTSIGAVVGAAYVLSPDQGAFEERVFAFSRNESLWRLQKQFEQLRRDRDNATWRHRFDAAVGRVRQLMLWNRQALRECIVDNRALAELSSEAAGDAVFEDARIPFCAVTYDLVGRQTVVMGSGPMASALQASSTIPGVFEPVHLDGMALVDGCVLQVVPAEVCRSMGAHAVIAVDIGSGLENGVPRSAAGVSARVAHIRAEHIREDNCAHADIVLRPDVSHIHWTDVSQSDQCFAAGREAARARLVDVLAAVRRRRWRTWLQRLLRRGQPCAGRLCYGSVSVPEAPHHD